MEICFVEYLGHGIIDLGCIALFFATKISSFGVKKGRQLLKRRASEKKKEKVAPLYRSTRARSMAIFVLLGFYVYMHWC